MRLGIQAVGYPTVIADWLTDFEIGILYNGILALFR